MKHNEELKTCPALQEVYSWTCSTSAARPLQGHIITCNKPRPCLAPPPPSSLAGIIPQWPICQTPKPQNIEQTRPERTGCSEWADRSLKCAACLLRPRTVTQCCCSVAIFTRIRNCLSFRRMTAAEEKCTCHQRTGVCVCADRLTTSRLNSKGHKALS